MKRGGYSYSRFGREWRSIKKEIREIKNELKLIGAFRRVSLGRPRTVFSKSSFNYRLRGMGFHRRK